MNFIHDDVDNDVADDVRHDFGHDVEDVICDSFKI
jgi:hypothetical protein